MIKEDIDKNEESTDKEEYKKQALPRFAQTIVKTFDVLFDSQKITRDFIVTTGKNMQKHGDYIQKAFEAIVELKDKNKILEKEVTLLKKELNELKSQGK